MIPAIIVTVCKMFPATIPHLSNRARYILAVKLAQGEAVKTEETFLNRVRALVRALYDGKIGGDFIDSMAALISRQIFLAHQAAWLAEGNEGEPLPDYLQESADKMALREFDFVDRYYRDIVDARTDETPIDPLLTRAELWAHRYTDAYEEAVHLITMENGGREEWVYGDTEHCWVCRDLNGIVLYATQWELLNVHPQGAPNPVLSLNDGTEKGCGGWRCECRREPTSKRRTRGGFEKVKDIIARGS